MPSCDLLKARLALQDRVLDRDMFFAKSRKLLNQVLVDCDLKQLGPEERQHVVRLYVRHFRAAIAALANEEDFDTVEYLIAEYNIHSQQVLAAGKGLILEEFVILRVHKDTQDELDQEIEEIRRMQREMTVPTVFRLAGWYKKEKQAALFQGLEKLAEFYYSR